MIILRIFLFLVNRVWLFLRLFSTFRLFKCALILFNDIHGFCHVDDCRLNLPVTYLKSTISLPFDNLRKSMEIFYLLDSVDSTNNYAMAKLHAGLAKHGQAWFAKDQQAGKGQ